MEETLSNRICRPAGDVCAVLHINWQQSSRERMVGNSPKSSWYDFSPIKDAWGFGDLPDIQTQLLNKEQFPSVLGSEQASLQLRIHSADICAFHTEPALSSRWVLCPQGARTTRADLSQGPALSRAQGLWTPRPAFFTGPHPPGWFETAHPWLPTTWMTFTDPHLYPVQRCFLTFPCCLVLPP